MKKTFILFAVILIHGNIALAASNNFLSKDWWKTATLEDVKKELKNGADVNAADDNDCTVLMNAVTFNPNLEVIKTLIDKGANVNAKGKEGWTVLTVASFLNSNPKVIETLISAGVDVNAKGREGWTALIVASFLNSNSKVIEMLISAGADVNAKMNDGTSVLLGAAPLQKTDTIKALLKAGADANVITNDGDIVAENAALNKNPEVHSLILQAMDIEGYCKLTKNNSFDIGLCIDEMNVYAQKEYMLPDCTHNMPAMLYLTPIIDAFANNTPNERKIIGWLTLAESAKRFNCSLGKTMYIVKGGEDFNKKREQELKIIKGN